MLTFFLGSSVSVLLVSVASSLTRQLDIGLLVFCRLLALCLYLPFSCLLAFRLVFLWRPYVGPSSGHIIQLIVLSQQTATLSSRLGLRLERMLATFPLLSSPFSLCVLFLPFSFFLECTNNTHGYVPGVIWLHVIPPLVSTVSPTDRYGTAVRTILYLFVFSHRDALLLQPVFVATGTSFTGK